MKTLKTISLSALILLGASSNLVAKKTDHDKVKINEEAFNSLTKQDQAKALDIQTHLNEIYSTDKTNLSKSEKKELKQELRILKEEVDSINQKSHNGHVIYISTGGLIIVILLLIILL
ncbi:MAG: hypothetical protein P1U44_10640 [Vicingaceae bacterium]|mgnify:CR=1 FL=1|jgi:peptidoglycan hydrolase CwlO-like protein|nr:hypothetical protein [Flavobacteriales bacterium]MBQ20744.1 hypothetical protein [Flavobacteriales bacterium]MDF1676162.1 hypothetical protein [Vicingaceae bacterium]|tara:strand:- start:37124 stop:37477 length:354 start_codon:yes stop_codon:yes gene_type:complete